MRNRLQQRLQATGTTRMLVSNNLEEAVYLDAQVLLLTRRPTHIAQIVPYPAPRSRHPHTLTSDEFVHAKALRLVEFRREVRS